MPIKKKKKKKTNTDQWKQLHFRQSQLKKMNKKPHNKKYYGENILSTLILFIDWFGGFTRENETQGENSFFFFFLLRQ